MENTTTLTFTMTAYATLENHKHLFFILFFLLYVAAMFLNILFVTVIHRNKQLHQPMNVFACMLCFNEIYGCTMLLIPVMGILMSKTHEISVKWCIAQVYFLHTYATAEFSILALMAYDRFVAIFSPLHYHTYMSPSKVIKLIAVAGLYPIGAFTCFFSLTLQLSFCGQVIAKLYCVNMELVKNACTIPSFISPVGLALIAVMDGPQLILIVYSYVQILRVTQKLSKDSQVSALKTCLPHLCSFFNFTVAGFFEIVQNRFDMSHVAIEVRIFLSMYFAVVAPVTNPLIYGLGKSLVRIHIIKLCVKYKTLPSKMPKRVIIIGTCTSNR
ncbi:olfactory receptor 52D1-like [Hippocampus comes]|uniref:olfactory receptor 52D1-like n=1 Tax=Hippocampus comes TaxID=109280 RepID=UPI00094E43A5|nr:PREDICTED: olfactory receptor 52D1-like [Hippocampus comes]